MQQPHATYRVPPHGFCSLSLKKCPQGKLIYRASRDTTNCIELHSMPQVPLQHEGLFNLAAIDEAIGADPAVRLLHIQRSCGYRWRPSIPIQEIKRCVSLTLRVVGQLKIAPRRYVLKDRTALLMRRKIVLLKNIGTHFEQNGMDWACRVSRLNNVSPIVLCSIARVRWTSSMPRKSTLCN